MKKTIPLVFLLCTVLILLMAFAHWVWQRGLDDIQTRQALTMNEIPGQRNASPFPPDRWQTRLKALFDDNPDLGVLLVRDRADSPLLLLSRLPQDQTGTLLQTTAPTNTAIIVQTREIQLPNGQSGSAVFAWTDVLAKAHTQRILQIAIVAALIIILGWILATILTSVVKRRQGQSSGTEVLEEIDPIEALSERNKKLSEEIEDLSGLREVAILAGKETSPAGLIRLAASVLAARADAHLRWIAIPRAQTLADSDPRIRYISPARYARLEAALGDGLRHTNSLLVPLSCSDKEFAIACLKTTPEHDQRAIQYMRQFASPLYSLILRAIAENDSLTGLFSRRSFDEILARVSREEASLPLTLILVDIDHFKEVNDSLGHPAGDLVLQRVASILHDGIPRTASACRYGGEEFALILPETGLPEAVSLAENLRMTVATAGMLQHRSVTASFGIAVARSTEEAVPALLLSRADTALYFSKQHGRNMVSSQGTGSPRP